MAMTMRAPQGESTLPISEFIGYEEALEVLSSDERFKSTVYAMNTMLIEKGIYTAEEFRYHFRQAAQGHLRRRIKA